MKVAIPPASGATGKRVAQVAPTFLEVMRITGRDAKPVGVSDGNDLAVGNGHGPAYLAVLVRVCRASSSVDTP